MIDAPTAHRLAGELVVAHIEDDPPAIRAVQLIWEHSDEHERRLFNAKIHLAVETLAARAVAELAEIYHCTPTEVIDRLRP